MPKRYFREWILSKGIDFGKLNSGSHELAKLRRQWITECDEAEKGHAPEHNKTFQSHTRNSELMDNGASEILLPQSSDTWREASPVKNSDKVAVSNKKTTVPVFSKPADASRFCTACGAFISAERVAAFPSVTRCIDCQTMFEGTHDTRPHIDEGLAGSRDGHKKMRGQVWGDMRNRGRGR